MKRERLMLRAVIADNLANIKELTETTNQLQLCLERMYCGCLSADCAEHGSYDPSDCDFVKCHLILGQ